MAQVLEEQDVVLVTSVSRTPERKRGGTVRASPPAQERSRGAPRAQPYKVVRLNKARPVKGFIERIFLYNKINLGPFT